MLNFEEFKKRYAGEVQNDSDFVWINEHTKTIASIPMFLKSESTPFEASKILDTNPDHEAWEDLYSSYLKILKEE